MCDIEENRAARYFGSVLNYTQNNTIRCISAYPEAHSNYARISPEFVPDGTYCAENKVGNEGMKK